VLKRACACKAVAFFIILLYPWFLVGQVGVVQQEILSELSEGLSSVEQLDMARAAELVESKLAPFLAEHDITPDKCHYTSSYYEPRV
jgi:hypothetical protein